MSPLVWRGKAALSAFRLEALSNSIEAALGSRRDVKAEFAYLLDVAEPLTADETARSVRLLDCDAMAPDAGGLYVAPRKGTISPWSTKASQIFQISGIAKVRRVERAIRYVITEDAGRELGADDMARVRDAISDRMTEGVYLPADLGDFFDRRPPAPGREFDVLGEGKAAIEKANKELGLAMSPYEIAYLADAFTAAKRNPTDTELVMFGQVNSEHCRHKIFNAEWIIDGEKRDSSLFGMVRETHKAHPDGTLVAYKDNSSVVEGFRADAFTIDPETKRYHYSDEQLDLLMKVETHNHPTAISPFPGAATGVGGEIRDESATGTGSKSKAGLAGFMVSNLRIPGHVRPWEEGGDPLPSRLATPLDIMIDGPIGGARFGNEFGRPQLAGFFRTYEMASDGRSWGYHKPIMLAGGMGSIRREHIAKKPIPEGSWIVQIGGPALRIGLGGGAASSMATGTNDEALDFDSVQRGNAEMERRAQEVIEVCTAMGDKNPILAIHDIGAGGLSNACPEIVEDTGADFNLRLVHNEEESMNPMEIWCCEAQERYMLAVRKEDRPLLEAICARERCPVAFIGVARSDRRLVLEDPHFGNRPIDMDIEVLLGKPPRMLRDVSHRPYHATPLELGGITPQEAFERILRLPSVAAKNFLVTIADRSVTGLVHRDQMVGPYQLPLADCAVTATGFHADSGEAMAIGERSPLAVVNAPASGRMAVGEALTNLAAAPVGAIGKVKLSANWMCACGEEGEDARLYDTVKAVTRELCISLGVSIPVGKDSLSMRTYWDADGKSYRQIAPLSLCVSAFSTIDDVRKTVTPDLKPGASRLILVDLADGRARLGGGALAQVISQVGDETPDLDDPAKFLAFFKAVQSLIADGRVMAYHDRSDGGLAVTLAEMAFGGGRGIDVELRGVEPFAALFGEELGCVLQVADKDADDIVALFRDAGILALDIGAPTAGRELTIRVDGVAALSGDIGALRSIWSETTYAMQSLRDNPKCAREEFEAASDAADPGMTFKVTYDPEWRPDITVSSRPRMAILREQGVNGHVEMAAAFDRAGFEAIDVHMTDLHEGRVDLADFGGLVACGGFSYGDVLGSGTGWASSILYSARLSEMFGKFFHRPETFTLGVCNGCQMVSQLKDLIPGAEDWPKFVGNFSEQFEARYETIEIMPSPSIFFKGMDGSRLPIAVAHGDGRAEFASDAVRDRLVSAGLASARYVDNHGLPTERYPFNPNGSKGGLTGFTTPDGRATIMMPHPERGFRSLQLSYRPKGIFEGEDGPWMRMFRNAFAFAAK